LGRTPHVGRRQGPLWWRRLRHTRGGFHEFLRELHPAPLHEFDDGQQARH
jgi:hypothetical protein